MQIKHFFIILQYYYILQKSTFFPLHLWYTKAIKNRKAVDGMKRFITGFVCGALLFGVVGALAVEYNVTPNPFKVMVDGQEVQIEGYNINDRSYFQLRDIGDAIGFSVGFVDGTVMIDSSGKPIEETQTQPEQPSNDVATPEEIQAYFDTFDIVNQYFSDGTPYIKTEDGYMINYENIKGVGFPRNAGFTFDGLKIYQLENDAQKLCVDVFDVSLKWRTTGIDNRQMNYNNTWEIAGKTIENVPFITNHPSLIDLEFYYSTLLPIFLANL